MRLSSTLSRPKAVRLNGYPISKDHSRVYIATHGIGAFGEKLAARFLRRAGYRIMARSFQSPLGEIDLICSSREWIVFAEVKTRITDNDDLPYVDLQQWRRIHNSARSIMRHRSASGRPFRFDLLAVMGPTRKELTVRHVEHAYVP